MPKLTDQDGNPVVIPSDSITHAFAEAMSAPVPEGYGESGYDDDAWWSLNLPDGGGIHMRVRRNQASKDSEWSITDVYVHARYITATMLQNIPISRLDLIMNMIGEYGSDVAADVVNEFAAEAGFGRAVIAPEVDDPDPTLAELRELAADAPPELPEFRSPERPRLTRPDGTDPENFYALVAAAYREYAPHTRAPAVKIAEEANVPVGTVRGWIREARRRGKLPQGRKGRVG